MGRKAVGILMVSGLAAIGAPAWAHHSMVAYEQGTTTTIQGVITAVKWTNPHMFIELAVPAEGGKTETWSIEGGGVNGAVKAGVTPKLLKLGRQVKVFGRRHLDHSKHMALLDTIEVDGLAYGRTR